MRKLSILCSITMLLLVFFTIPTLATGYFDEILFSSEWWPSQGQHGAIELTKFGIYAGEDTLMFEDPLGFSWRQSLGKNSFFVLNGVRASGEGIYNLSVKFGTPDSYFSVGGVSVAELLFPRINLGRKFALGQGLKLVADADFYTLIIANLGKVDLGLELNALNIIQLYGGVTKYLILVGAEALPVSDLTYELGGKVDLKILYGKVNYYSISSGELMNGVFTGEAGINLGFLTLMGRVVSTPSAVEDLGVYSVGISLNY